jgi:hypothetical protein
VRIRSRAGIIAFTGILELIEFLESDFGVEVSEAETVPENLGSISRLTEFVMSKLSVREPALYSRFQRNRGRLAGGVPVNGDIVGQVLGDCEALRRPDADPELEAVRGAVLVEDVFDVVLSDAEIDPGVLAGPAAAAALVARLRGAV